MSEATLQKATLDLARLLGWRIARFPMLNLGRDGNPRKLAYDTKGMPDTLLFRDRCIGVEFKNETREVTEEQQAWDYAFHRAGVAWYCWRPADWHSGAIEAALR